VTVHVSATPRLRRDIPRLARGRAIVIDYDASAKCGVVVGDITARFEADPRAKSQVRLVDLDGVPVFVDCGLTPLLERTQVVLDRHLLGGDRLGIRLGAPESWLDVLESPGVVRRRMLPFRRSG
jgi:hypothetical protein